MVVSPVRDMIASGRGRNSVAPRMAVGGEVESSGPDLAAGASSMITGPILAVHSGILACGAESRAPFTLTESALDAA
jgi:hypothetical protein